MNFIKILFICVCASLFPVMGYACEDISKLPSHKTNHSAAESVHVCHAWVRLPGANVKTTAAYLYIHNTTQIDDTLISVESAIVDRVELHETKITNGIATMRALPNGIAISKGAHIEMKPGGIHIMLIGLKSALTETDKLQLKLNFAKHPPIVIDAKIAKTQNNIEHDHQHHQH